MGLPPPFPKIKNARTTSNPAFVLFGSRFYRDQTVVELLAEFLSIVFATKWIGSNGPINTPLPQVEDLRQWANTPEQRLRYDLEIRLNLKLLALLGASPLSLRHQVHVDHYEYLVQRLMDRVRTQRKKPEEVKEWVEDFLMGFQGAGSDRTWCAQTFYPISRSFLSQEAIWKRARSRDKRLYWSEISSDPASFFGIKQHLFLARGGELIYLQLCNLFSKDDIVVDALAKKLGYNEQQFKVDSLYKRLELGFQQLETTQPIALDALAEFIENLDPKPRWKSQDSALYCEWCPEESWPEAYLLAVELSRILSANLDPVERLELVQFSCGLHVLRSMCAQSVRYANLPDKGTLCQRVLGYAWLFSPMQRCSRQQRLAACHNMSTLFRAIQQALRNEYISRHVDSVKNERRISESRLDLLYGHKLFSLLGKRLGIIYPWKGAEPRFVLTDRLVRFLVLSIVEPGATYTYDEFKRKIYLHYGIAVEGEELMDAINWTGLPVNSSTHPAGSSWFAQMLRAGGFLIELSDGCSVVRNPFSKQF